MRTQCATYVSTVFVNGTEEAEFSDITFMLIYVQSGSFSPLHVC